MMCKREDLATFWKQRKNKHCLPNMPYQCAPKETLICSTLKITRKVRVHNKFNCKSYWEEVGRD